MPPTLPGVEGGPGMAEPHQLEVLRQGVNAWNRWRAANPSVIVDLSYARLGNAILRGARLDRALLCHADLHGADLGEADLTSADLESACLTGVNLACANLTGAKLSAARLVEVDLDQANLTGADLTGSNLNSANLRAANLRKANLIRASLVGATLRAANLQAADLRWADLSCADVRGALLEGAMFTPLGDPVGMSSFLDLAMSVGVRSAIFSLGVLQQYLSQAREYARRLDTPEARWGYAKRVSEALEHPQSELASSDMRFRPGRWAHWMSTRSVLSGLIFFGLAGLIVGGLVLNPEETKFVLHLVFWLLVVAVVVYGPGGVGALWIHHRNQRHQEERDAFRLLLK
jgi:hypothetical protein